jgi:hypothetical protein
LTAKIEKWTPFSLRLKIIGARDKYTVKYSEIVHVLEALGADIKHALMLAHNCDNWAKKCDRKQSIWRQ